MKQLGGGHKGRDQKGESPGISPPWYRLSTNTSFNMHATTVYTWCRTFPFVFAPASICTSSILCTCTAQVRPLSDSAKHAKLSGRHNLLIDYFLATHPRLLNLQTLAPLLLLKPSVFSSHFALHRKKTPHSPLHRLTISSARMRSEVLARRYIHFRCFCIGMCLKGHYSKIIGPASDTYSLGCTYQRYYCTQLQLASYIMCKGSRLLQCC